MILFCNLQQKTKDKVGTFSCNGCDPYTLICCKKSFCEYQIETPPITASNNKYVAPSSTTPKSE